MSSEKVLGCKRRGPACRAASFAPTESRRELSESPMTRTAQRWWSFGSSELETSPAKTSACQKQLRPESAPGQHATIQATAGPPAGSSSQGQSNLPWFCRIHTQQYKQLPGLLRAAQARIRAICLGSAESTCNNTCNCRAACGQLKPESGQSALVLQNPHATIQATAGPPADSSSQNQSNLPWFCREVIHTQRNKRWQVRLQEDNAQARIRAICLGSAESTRNDTSNSSASGQARGWTRGVGIAGLEAASRRPMVHDEDVQWHHTASIQSCRASGGSGGCGGGGCVIRGAAMQNPRCRVRPPRPPCPCPCPRPSSL